MGKINIVVGADITEYKVAVKSKIQDDDMSIIGYSDFGPDAEMRIQGFVPDVFVCSVPSTKIDDEFLAYIDSMNLSAMGCAVVILTDNVTVSIVNQAAQYGVRQVMPVDIEAEDFVQNIKKINQNEKKISTKLNVERKVRSRVYSFFSGKGGVGKTTLCTNIAVQLASRGKRTLLVDLDLQFGDADMALDMEPKDTIVELCRDPNGISIDNITAYSSTHPSGLSVIASPSSPELAEYVKAAQVGKLVEVARPYFEYIILDCGCTLTDPVITGLESSDQIFVVNDVNILSLKRAKLCQNVMHQINQQDKVKLVINKNVKKNNVKVSDFETLLGVTAYAVISSDAKTVNQSLNNGQPFSTFKPRASITKEIKAFVDKMIKEKEE